VSAGIEAQIGRLQAGLDDFLAALAGLDDERFLAPLGNWTPRDVVAHLIGWCRAVIRGSEEMLRGELPWYDADPGEDFARVNAAFLREYPSEDRATMVAELRTAAGELAAFLRALDPADWDRATGVRHGDEALTVAATVEETLRDFGHHARQLLE